METGLSQHDLSSSRKKRGPAWENKEAYYYTKVADPINKKGNRTKLLENGGFAGAYPSLMILAVNQRIAVLLLSHTLGQRIRYDASHAGDCSGGFNSAAH